MTPPPRRVPRTKTPTAVAPAPAGKRKEDSPQAAAVVPVTATLAHPTAQRARADAMRAGQRRLGNAALAAQVDGDPGGPPRPVDRAGALAAYFGPETDLPPPPPEHAPAPPAPVASADTGPPAPAAIGPAATEPAPAAATPAPSTVTEAANTGPLAAFFGPETDAAAPAPAAPGQAGAGREPAAVDRDAQESAPARMEASAPQTVEEWRGQVRAAAEGLPRPRVSGGGGGFKAVGDAAAERGEKARAEVAATAQRQVPPRPRVPEPPGPPPDPVPEATKAVRDAADKTLPDLVLPALVATPAGTEPKLVPAPQPPAAPKETEPPAKPGPTSKRQPAQRVPAEKAAAEPKADPPKVPTLQDTRTPAVLPLPPQLALKVGEVVARLGADIPKLVDDALKMARRNAYRGAALADPTIFPDLDTSIRPPLEAALTGETDKLAGAIGLEPQHYAAQVSQRRTALAGSQEASATQTKEAADEAAKKAKAEADKTATAIGKERQKAAREATERMRKAMTSTKPQFITDVRDEILVRLRTEVTRGAAAHRRAGERRGERIKYYADRYAEAYRTADTKDMQAQIAAGRGIPNLNRDPATGRPWLSVRIDALSKEMGALTQQAKDAAEALAKGLEDTAGPRAYDLVRDWAAQRLGHLRDDDTRRQERAQDLDAQARGRIEAEAEVRAAENRDALLNDLALLDLLTTKEEEKKGKEAAEKAVQLTEEQRKDATRYFGLEGGPRDPIVVLAEKLSARLTQDPARQAELVTTYREKVEKIDPFTLDKDGRRNLAAVLFNGDKARPETITSEIMAQTWDKTGTGEEEVYAALAGLTRVQTRLVDAVFREQHPRHWSLEKQIDDEFSGSEYDRAIGLARGNKIVAAAAAVYDAVIGPGTNEKLVYATLRGLSPEDLKLVKEYYAKTYGESMDAALRGDFSDNELARAQALAAGDKDKADSYALAEASRSSIWGGPDYKAIAEVHDQIRQDVANANPGLSSSELDAEIRRRTGEVESSYEKYPGEGKSLKAMYQENLKGATYDMAVALIDNDMDGADAARAEIEARRAEQSGGNANDELGEIAKARHERMLDKVRRDEGRSLYDKLADQIKARKDAGNPMTPWEREKAERDIQVELRKRAEAASETGMSTLEKRFDEKYKGVYRRYGPNGEVLETKEGGFAAMRDMFATSAEAKTLTTKGYLTLAQEIRYSVQGAGTNEDRLRNVTKGRTKAEIDEARIEYKRDYDEDMDQRIHDELDEGTRDRFDVDENLRGVPETPQQMLDAARRRYEFETTTYGAGGRIELAPDARQRLDDDFKDVQTRLAKLTDPAHRPTGEELDRLYGDFAASTRVFEASATRYRSAVDDLVDTITQVVGAVVGIVVAVVIIVASGGTAAPGVVALVASLYATAATIATKMVLLGRAYGVEDLGQDLALGAVDAAISVATAGVGDKLLKVAKGAANPGVLARMAASSSRAARVTARAAAEVIENAVQAAPNALAATLVDDNTYRGDVFKNILVGTAKGTAVNLGTGLAMGTAMHVGGRMVGGVRAEWDSMRGKPPPDVMATVEGASARAHERAGQPGRPADVLQLRGTAPQRQAAFLEFRNQYPGATYPEFLRALDNGLASIQAGADAAHQMQRAMRRELLDAVPPELRSTFAKTPIEVVSDADFEAFGRSRTGQAIVIIDNGRPRVLIRESAGPGVLREEGVHLWQSVDPRTAKKVAFLDETRLRDWDTFTVAEKVELYRVKLDLELDAQLRLMAHLDAQLRRADLDPRLRASLEADLHGARQTFDNLRGLKGQVDDLGPADLIGISRGERASPVDLDQPSRLFAKRSRGGTTTPAAVRPQYADIAAEEIVPAADSPMHDPAKGVVVFQIGPARYEPNRMAQSGWYRDIMIVDKGHRTFREEAWQPPSNWVESGSSKTARGGALEIATGQYFDRLQGQVAAGTEMFHFEPPRIAREGFDRVVIMFDADGVARIRLLEIKRTKRPQLSEFTALGENFDTNFRTVLMHLMELRARSLSVGAETHGMVFWQLDRAVKAMQAGRIDIQVVIGPESIMGPRTRANSVLRSLETDIRSKLDPAADLRMTDPVQLRHSDLTAAERTLSEGAAGTPGQRLAALSERGGIVTPETLAEARALLRAEADGVLTGPVRRGPSDGIFYDGNGEPVRVMRPGGPGYKPSAAAKEILSQLGTQAAHAAPPHLDKPVRVVLDDSRLSPAQRRGLREALRRQAHTGNQTHLLQTMLNVQAGRT